MARMYAAVPNRNFSRSASSKENAIAFKHVEKDGRISSYTFIILRLKNPTDSTSAFYVLEIKALPSAGITRRIETPTG